MAIETKDQITRAPANTANNKYQFMILYFKIIHVQLAMESWQKAPLFGFC